MELGRQAFFDDHPDPMWIYDRATLGFLAVNDAAVAQYGYTRAEFLAMTIADIRPPEDVPALKANIAAQAARPQSAGDLDLAGIWRHCRRTGEIIHVDIRSQALIFEGRPAELVAARDVTRLVELEREKASLLAVEREAVLTLRAAQRLLNLGTWKLDLGTGRLSWSEEVYALYGVSPQDFGLDFDAYVALVHPDDRAGMLEHYRQFAVSDDERFTFQHRVVRADGRIAQMRGVGEVVQGPDGPSLAGVVQDITAQVEGEERLAAANSLVRIAGQAARLGGWRVDLDSGRVEWSEVTAAIHGRPDVRHLSVEEALVHYPPEFRDRIEAVYRACREEGRPYDEILQILTGQGQRVWVRAIGEAERDGDGRIRAVGGAFQDISELVAARERSDALSRRLQETLESISDGFFTLDSDWRFSFLNGQAERLLGRKRAELLGRNIWAAFPEAVGTSFQSGYERAMRSGQTVRYTEFYPPLAAWFQVSAYPIPGGLAVYFRDVTQERADQQQLRLLEAAVARQNDILVITDASPLDAPDGPRIVFVNDAFSRLTGYGRAEVLGKTPRLLQGAGTSRAELDRIRAALEAGRPVRAELQNYTRRGEAVWLEMDIVPIAGRGGEVTHWVSAQRDVTERRATEAALRVSEERFHLVARATNDTVWDWDLAEDRLWWNENMATMFGHDPRDLAPGAESWSGNIHPEDRERVLRRIHEAIAGTASNWEDEYRFLCADGRLAIVFDRGFIIRDPSGQAVRMLGSMIDMTERRELDDRLRQSQKLEAVGQLTGGVAHDFNNLLTVILGNAELLTEKLTDQQQLRLLAEMTATAAERGAELTNRLLAFARRQALEPRPVDVNRLVAGMDGLLRRTLPEEIEIEIVRAGGLWLAEVDPGQLEGALLNLCINARDAMPGGGRLTIETANAVLDQSYADAHDEVVAGQYVFLSVSDTGAGMTPEVAARAFEPFFTTKEVGKGSGLGLSMVYGFVKQSGGHAKIYSEPGEGSTIKLYLPRLRDGSGERAGSEPAADTTGGEERILVVEDDPLVRQHLVTQLQGLGYRVVAASTGTQAMELLQREPRFDLLFTDLVMPGGMNGRELAEAAARLWPGLKVLFTSGYTENAIVHQGRLDRGVLLLAKPYRRQELAAKVRRALDA